jgi:hypothetical protein
MPKDLPDRIRTSEYKMFEIVIGLSSKELISLREFSSITVPIVMRSLLLCVCHIPCSSSQSSLLLRYPL